MCAHWNAVMMKWKQHNILENFWSPMIGLFWTFAYSALQNIIEVHASHWISSQEYPEMILMGICMTRSNFRWCSPLTRNCYSLRFVDKASRFFPQFEFLLGISVISTVINVTVRISALFIFWLILTVLYAISRSDANIKWSGKDANRVTQSDKVWNIIFATVMLIG